MNMEGGFYFSRLNEQAKLIYQSLNKSIRCGPASDGVYQMYAFDCSTAINDGLNAIEAIRLDKPEYFFLSSQYEVSLYNRKLSVRCKNLYSLEQIRRVQPLLRDAIARLTMGLGYANEWERERVVYERIVKDRKYGVIGKPENHNILNAALRNEGVCEGYSKLLALALRKLCIPCILIYGHGAGEKHCWNMAKINGKVYHLDVTWEPEAKGHCNYTYFNLCDSEIKKDHTIYTKGLPSADCTKLEYHIQTGCFFTSSREAAKYIHEKLWRGDKVVRVRLSQSIDVMSMQGILVLPPFNTYRYLINENRNSIMIIKE